MRHVLFLSLFAMVQTRSDAFADIPLPPGTKYVEPRVRFIGIEKQPGVLFFLTYETGQDYRYLVPVTVEVKNDREFTLKNTGRFITGTRLLAIRQEDFEKLKNRNPPVVGVTADTPGVMAAGIVSPENTASTFSLRAPLTTYRVSLKNGTVEVQPGTKERSQAPAGGLPLWAIGLAVALSFSSLGLWFTRPRKNAAAMRTAQ